MYRKGHYSNFEKMVKNLISGITFDIIWQLVFECSINIYILAFYGEKRQSFTKALVNNCFQLGTIPRYHFLFIKATVLGCAMTSYIWNSYANAMGVAWIFQTVSKLSIILNATFLSVWKSVSIMFKALILKVLKHREETLFWRKKMKWSENI